MLDICRLFSAKETYNEYSQSLVGWHSILRLFLKTFNLVPCVPGFSWDSSIITWYFTIHHLLLGTNRKSHGQNSGSLQKFYKSSRDAVPPYLQLAVTSLPKEQTHLKDPWNAR